MRADRTAKTSNLIPLKKPGMRRCFNFPAYAADAVGANRDSPSSFLENFAPYAVRSLPRSGSRRWMSLPRAFSLLRVRSFVCLGQTNITSADFCQVIPNVAMRDAVEDGLKRLPGRSLRIRT